MSEDINLETLKYFDQKFGSIYKKLDSVDNRLVAVETDLKYIRNGKKKEKTKHSFDVKLDLTKVFYFLIAGVLALCGIKIIF